MTTFSHELSKMEGPASFRVVICSEDYRVTSLIRTPPPHRTTVGP